MEEAKKTYAEHIVKRIENLKDWIRYREKRINNLDKGVHYITFAYGPEKRAETVYSTDFGNLAEVLTYEYRNQLVMSKLEAESELEKLENILNTANGNIKELLQKKNIYLEDVERW